MRMRSHHTCRQTRIYIAKEPYRRSPESPSPGQSHAAREARIARLRSCDPPALMQSAVHGWEIAPPAITASRVTEEQDYTDWEPRLWLSALFPPFHIPPSLPLSQCFCPPSSSSSSSCLAPFTTIIAYHHIP